MFLVLVQESQDRMLMTRPYLQAVMVGDDVLNDVGGAQRCGLMGILVRTGKYRYV